MPAAIEQPISVIARDLIHDLSALQENEDTIIDFLLERLQHGQIYTWAGSVLLTLNPMNEISTSHLYDRTEFDKHVNSLIVPGTNPHIFTMAGKAHYNLVNELGRNSQVIVISGETGTGKTFNAYKCLEFLNHVNRNSMELYQGDYTYDIMQKIIDACRLVSVFATACTEKNEVSSRHGQLIKLHYRNNIISGATINSFLLERSRVTKGSSNFQIFYQMIFGMSYTELETFYLSKRGFYNILKDTDCSKERFFHEGFQDILKTLSVLDFMSDQKKHIFQVLALIIHMGNIKFVEHGEGCGIDFDNVESREALKITCILSSLTENTVRELLTSILINPQSTWRKHTAYHRNLSTIDACCSRLHSIIRHIYDLLFHWILNHINNSLFVRHECTQWLGILDIFGFEAFEKNGIEQLCVNYANERMQQYFIETYMENGYNDLQEEGFIQDYNGRKDTLDLYHERLNVIEKHLFLTLNDVCQSPTMVNVPTTIVMVLKNLHSTQRKYLKEKEGNFIIRHYSGPVAYSVKDLLSKNTDKVPSEISFIFNQSKNKFLRNLINLDKEQHLHNIKVSTRKKTTLAKLKYNIDTLLKELSKCDLHYVRCVRPSRTRSHEWDRKEFRKQLACIGIFDALPLAKCKYPIRLCYQDFVQRYSKKPSGIFDINKCTLILESIAPKKDWPNLLHFGKHLIFLTETIFHKLEINRRNYRMRCADKIRTFWMKHRRKVAPTISKYAVTNNYQLLEKRKIKESIKPVKVILDCELKKLNKFEIDNVTCITKRTLSTSNHKDKTRKDTDVQNGISLNEEINDKNEFHCEQRNIDNCQNKYKSSKLKYKSGDCFKSSIFKLIRKIKHDYGLLGSKRMEQKNMDDQIVDINYNDPNNNLVKNNKNHTSLTITKSTSNIPGKKCCIDYDMEKLTYTFNVDSSSLFYKNGILSRRRLAAIPIRMHTRATCLTYSHVLPRVELPRGLQDCL